ncbi:MAG TPA: twin-arginine translocase subunit TatC [Pseudomonadales bacterium]
MARRDPREHDALVESNEQPFLEHVIELRARILRALLAIAVAFIPTYYFANEIYEFVAAPLMAHLPENSTMIATAVASPFLTPFRLAIYAAVFVMMPFILYQVWAFVAPGLYFREKRFAFPLLVSAVLLFYTGTAFAYFLVFPVVFQFFAQVAPSIVTWATDINQYLDFVLKLFFAFGFVFEVPIAVLLMVWSGLTSADALASKRPYVIVGCFVVGMLLTPPDVLSQLMLAVPTWLLFELGVLFARLVERRTAESDAEGEAKATD